jgi:hypothetical protein
MHFSCFKAYNKNNRLIILRIFKRKLIRMVHKDHFDAMESCLMNSESLFCQITRQSQNSVWGFGAAEIMFRIDSPNGLAMIAIILSASFVVMLFRPSVI